MKRQSGLKRFATAFTPLLLMVVFILFPFYWTFVTPVKPQDELYGAVVIYWPDHITFEACSKLSTITANFFAAMKNSFIATSLTTIVSLTASTLAAYAFSRYQFTGRKILMYTFLCNNMFLTVLLLIPLHTTMRKMRLLYIPASLALSYTTFTIPFSVWLLLGLLNDLPMSLREAALVDGCSRGPVFLEIILPILGPCLVATGAYVFMTSWNEYTFVMVFTSMDTRTIPVALKSLIGQLGVQQDLLTAGGIITITPACIIFFFVQERLVEGLTAGVVKGQL